MLAQYETASVLGFVRDSSGAPIAGGRVQLINVATGTVVTATTNGQGQFEFPDVQVGSYKIDSTAEGFSESVTSPFAVSVNARQRVDVKLQPGSVSQTVTVTDAATQLQTETSDSSTIINHSQVVNLPLNGRAYGDLAPLVPGVRRNALENPSSVTSRDASFNVNGQRSEFNNFLLDGLDNNAYGTSNQGFSNQTIPPSPDAINEFQVDTNNYSAEYGRASGAVVNVSINSGSNQFHGRVWEYNRNTALNALGPFLPPTNTLTGQTQKPTLIRNQFGGALGGPIKRDKLFFFVDYEGERQVMGSFVSSTVPTALQRQGIFTDSKGNPVSVHDPVLGTSYANGVVPQTAWTPLAQLVIAALPAPNVAGISNNYATIGNSSIDDNKGDGRVDYTWSDKTTVFGRYSQHYADIVDINPIPGAAGGTSNYNGNLHIYNKAIAAGVTHAFDESKVLDARLGFTWTQGGKTPYGAGQTSLNEQAGIPGLPTDPNVIRLLSSEAITNFTTYGAQTSNPQFQNPFTINPKVNYSFLKGRHSVKVGYEWLSLNTEIDDFNPVYGSETFNGAFSQYGTATDTTCGAGDTCGTADAYAKQDAYLADFFFGARSAYQLNNFVIINQHQMMNFAYVQDDWKLTPRLTVNAGLRYENATSPVVDGNHLANFSQTGANTGTLVQATGGSHFDRSLVHTASLDFAPRLGFSYQADAKTAVRAAYGLSFDQFNREGGENLLAYNGPYIVNTSVNSQTPLFAHTGTGTPEATCTGENSANCFRTVAQGYPDGFVSSANFSTATSEVRYIPTSIPTGYVQTWHLDVQRELTQNTVFTASYVGSHGVHLWVLADWNQSNFNAPGASLGVDARRPITGFTTIEVSLPDGFLSYNALQTKLEHRFSGGLYLLNSFTWSRAEDNAAGHLDTPNGDNSRINILDPLYDRGTSAYNQPLNESLSVVYDLPFGRGRKFGANIDRWTDLALGGWQLTAINTASSGPTINLNYTPTNAQTVSSLLVYRPNVSGPVIAPSSNRVKTSTALTGYFNTANVAAPTGTDPFGNAGRNSVYGPAYNDLDLGLHKAFSLWAENAKLDVRGEAFNLLNHVNYSVPAYNVSATSFGSITSANPARELQVAAKIIF